MSIVVSMMTNTKNSPGAREVLFPTSNELAAQERTRALAKLAAGRAEIDRQLAVCDRLTAARAAHLAASNALAAAERAHDATYRELAAAELAFEALASKGGAR